MLCSSAVGGQQSYRVAAVENAVTTKFLFDHVASQTGIAIDYQFYPSVSDTLSAVEIGEADFSANIAYSPQRANKVKFTAPIHSDYSQIYTKPTIAFNEATRIGVPKASDYGAILKSIFPYTRLIEFSGQEEGISLLIDDRADAVIDSVSMLERYLSAGYQATLASNELNVKALAVVAHQDVPGQLLKQIERLFLSDKQQVAFRQAMEGYQFAVRRKVLRHQVRASGISLNHPVKVKLENAGLYATYQPDGRVQGVAADILFQACDILMLRCEVTSSADEPWEQMYQQVIDKEVDLIAPINISPARQQLFYFSSSFYQPKAVMVKREGYKSGVYRHVSELLPERIGVIEGDFYQDLLGEMLPQKSLYSFPNQRVQVAALLNGAVDYIVLSEANFYQVLANASQLLPIEMDSGIGTFHTSRIALGFARTPYGQELATLFSQAIEIVDIQAVIAHYTHKPDLRATLRAEQNLARHVQNMFALLLLVLLALSVYLYRQARTDNLTRLRNRRALHSRYRRGIGSGTTLVYLDINDFKPINDSYGHEVGDQVLKDVAHYIRTHWPGRAYRIGGDEFILIGKTSRSALKVLTATLSRFHFRDHSKNIDLNVSIAMGVSLPDSKGKSLARALDEADQDMYRLKSQSGRKMTSLARTEQAELADGEVSVTT
ncbi:diguanylate cyclase domain-containing protein [Vibrio sp.]|uniref:diguanylate cyclase domain-containing protein n=1 Tax=Vibrio sp. TaxID=678 RepID=UPI003D133355